MAGLACATAIAEAGVPVVVCERHARAGGRATSWIDAEHEAEIDNGPHLFAGVYEHVRRLLARIGSEELLPFPDHLRVPLRALAPRRTAVLECRALPGDAGVALGLLAFDALAWTERWRLRAVLRAARSGEPRPDRALGAWLTELGQGERARRWLWDPLARAVFNEEPDRVSAALFAEVVLRLFSGGARPPALAHPRAGLASLYARPAVRYLERRAGRVRTLAEAAALEPREGGQRVRLAGGESIEARGVCLAVPPAGALALLRRSALEPPARLVEAAAIESAPLVSVNLWIEGDEPLLDEPFLGLVDAPFAWAFERDAWIPGRPGRRHLVLVAPGDRALAAEPAPAVADRARDTLHRLAPEARSRALLGRRVVKEMHAAPSLTPQAAARRPAVETGIDGLWLAGDTVDTGLPATLESAAQSGHRAARRALDYRGARSAC